MSDMLICKLNKSVGYNQAVMVIKNMMDFYYIVKAVFNIRNKHTTPYLNHNPKLNETHGLPPGKLDRVLRKK